MVREGCTVGGLFDGADDAFAELHPHVTFPLVRVFLLALSDVFDFCGGEHCGDTIVFVLGGASGLCWCWSTSSPLREKKSFVFTSEPKYPLSALCQVCAQQCLPVRKVYLCLLESYPCLLTSGSPFPPADCRCLRRFQSQRRSFNSKDREKRPFQKAETSFRCLDMAFRLKSEDNSGKQTACLLSKDGM